MAQTATPAATPAIDGPAFEVLFIRHAENEINVLPAGGDLPVDDGITFPLTTLGVQQAQTLDYTPGNTEISAIHTSIRLLCIQAADAIAINTGLPLKLLAGIVETSFGTSGCQVKRPIPIDGLLPSPGTCEPKPLQRVSEEVSRRGAGGEVCSGTRALP